MRDIVLYATDTMADWEFASITTEITRAEQSRPGRFRLVLAGATTGTVTTLGGLPVVSDRGVITGTGLRPVEFSGAVFREVGLYPDSLIDAWLALQASNEADDFFRLMDEYGAFANA